MSLFFITKNGCWKTADVQKNKKNTSSFVSNDREFPSSRLQVKGRLSPESHFAK